MEKLTAFQHAVLGVIKCQPYVDVGLGIYDYKFVSNERNCALRLERRGLIKRIDERGNYFVLSSDKKRKVYRARKG